MRAYNSSVRYPDFTNTWFDTNDATLEFASVGGRKSATPFEHEDNNTTLTMSTYFWNLD